MPLWDGLDLVLALWAPLVVVGSIVGAWALLTPHPTSSKSLDGPARRQLEPNSTTTLQAMLDLAEEHTRAWLSTKPCGSIDRARRESSRDALQIATLVAISLVRDWTARLDRERLGPHAASVIDEIRSHTGEALVLLASLCAPDQFDDHHPQCLQRQLALLAADLRRFQDAVRPAGLDPYR
ncbi:hypothetical protein [Paraliomyxa miuraensis]|uniref:hypothetical protein n=1 Tax=Paraliomyxa miuraensis TaxID=376150 RepID=UPI002255F0C9|nr:hypothetical protein [Paraliomyxa miuraensis]MCX4243327.1 hypothetical protein [Paraliomyxa miuraensis]